MATEEKDIQIIDLNLFSGSSDLFRTSIGSYFYISDSDSGETVEQKSYSPSRAPYIAKISAKSTTLAEEASSETIIPTKKFPVRVYGNSSVYSDKFWKIYWTGGTFGEDYPGIYSEDIFDDYWFENSLPYSKLEVANLVGGSAITNEIEVSYDYNFYLKDYQDYVGASSSELLIPNMYLIEMLYKTASKIDDIIDADGLLAEDSDSNRTYDDAIWDFVALEDTLPDFFDVSTRKQATRRLSSDIDDRLLDNGVSDLLSQTDRGTGYIHAYGKKKSLIALRLHQYLTGAVPFTSLSSSTTEYVENALQNMMFDQNSIAGDYLKNPFVTMETRALAYPYYVKINFPAHGTDIEQDTDKFEVSSGDNVYFAESIVNNSYSAKFLKSLKEAFNEEVDDINIATEEYVLTQNYLSSGEDDDTDTEVETAENTSFNTVDYFDLLTYSYKNYESLTDNCFFVGEKSITREAAMDTTGTYRYINSKNALGVLRDALSTLTEAGSTSTAEIYDDELGFKALFKKNNWRSSSGKYNEIVAYRIEKIGGEITGDSKTQNALQNFWIFNSPNLTDNINLFDSQVKYGENYTYNVYKYVIVVGVKYGFSDLALTKTTNEAEGTYYLEFYDPASEDEEVTDTLYLGANDDASTTSNTEYKYMADFNVTAEPTIKIFEIPMFSKTLKVLDHPPNQLNLNPFFLLDDSQVIGYKVNYETFVKQEYPTAISSDDEELKTDYLYANDMLTNDELTLESRSQQRYVQVYRLSEMPTAYTDFDGQLLSTIDLILENSVFTLSNTIMYDKINTNQKYYYLFRILNENLVPGYTSEIYEAELINDGGYTYGMFDLLFAEDLEIDNFTNPIDAFKKLIQLQPNVSQVSFSDENVDYDDTASSQLGNMGLSSADDPIWDKTFKIRLTSKKTGRKMVLNVTYKYETNSN